MAKKIPGAVKGNTKDKNEEKHETLGQGIFHRSKDRCVYRRERPCAGPGAGALRRAGQQGTGRDAEPYRGADRRGTRGCAPGIGRHRGGDRKRRFQDRGRVRGRPLQDRIYAHRAFGRYGQEDPYSPLAQRPGAGRHAPVCAGRIAAYPQGRAHAFRSAHCALGAVQGCPAAGLHPSPGGDAFFVRVVVRGVCREPGGRRVPAQRGVPHCRSESLGFGGRVRFVVSHRSRGNYA